MSIYAIFDKVAQSYGMLNVDTSDATAKRNFEFAVSQSPQLQFFCKSYELRKLADFDEKTGVITTLVPSEFICSGEEVMPRES